MARTIDADRLLRELTALSHGQVWPGWTYDGIRLLIERQPTLTQPNETPPCYQPDGDGCAYQCYDGDDEPIDKCKECPLCYSDKQRHRTTLNEPLTLEQLREMDEIPIYVVTEKYGSGWCVLSWHGVKKSYTYFSRTGTSEGMTATPLSAKTYGDLWIAYRRPPEGEA